VSGRTVWVDQLSADELAALDPGVPQTLERHPDILVVGGGILGVAIALACHAAGLGSVLLIDRHKLGGEATGGAAGLLVPEAHRGTDPDALVELGRTSLAGWRRLEANSVDGVGLVDVDWFILSSKLEDVANRYPEGDWLDTDGVARLLPGLVSTDSAVRIPHQARVNPLRAVGRLATQIPQVATGVTATAITARSGRVLTVSTSAGTIAPGAVVFATGMPPNLTGLDLRLPADLVKGHLVVTEPVPTVLPGLLASLATQLEDGSLLIGGTMDTDDPTTEVREEIIDRIRREFVDAFPALHRVRIGYRWCCWRPHHPDGLPVIDRIPGIDNAWVTSGHYRTGVLMAPATGSIIATWIGTGEQPWGAEAWAIERRGPL
jgi:glycine/D-amino acid oxidase-like deaminating enzyme